MYINRKVTKKNIRKFQDAWFASKTLTWTSQTKKKNPGHGIELTRN